MAGTKEELRRLYDSYLNKSLGFRKIEYNWRDVALYGLAVGAGADEPQYYYEKVLETLPTFGALPCYNALNNEPQKPQPCTSFHPLWDDLDRLMNDGKKSVGLDFDHEIIFHRSPNPIKGTLLYEDKIIKYYDRGDKGVVVRNYVPVYDEAGVLLCENYGNAALFIGGDFGGDPFPASPVVFPDRKPDVVEDDYISPTQNALYRLTGDTNLVHVDRELAQEWGMKGAFMQGFCPMGFCARHLANNYIPHHMELAKRIKVQFRSVCYPDTKIRFEAWKMEEGKAWFRLMNIQTGKPVIDKGEFEWRTGQ